MLIQFNFSNSRSFLDKATLDLSATRITENSEHVRTVGGERLLPVSAIYGANASGKSNIYHAFRWMADFVARSLEYSEEREAGAEDARRGLLSLSSRSHRPFQFLAKPKEESRFEVFFIDPADEKEKTVQYGFAIDADGNIVEEWMFQKAKTALAAKKLFHRDKDKLDTSGLPVQDSKGIEGGLKKDALLLTLGSLLGIKALKSAALWFRKNVPIGFGGLFFAPMSMYFPRDDDAALKEMAEYLRAFDDSIQGIDVQVQEKVGVGRRVVAKTVHGVLGSDGIADPELRSYLPAEEESDGTQQMIRLFPSIKKALRNGSVLFIDELSTGLHPLLARNIILTFASPERNPNNAQLIFTTHDVYQLLSGALRRDEIWFVEKNPEGISELYSLVEFVGEDGDKIRKDENYLKNYIMGKYGAIPSLDPLYSFGADKRVEKQDG